MSEWEVEDSPASETEPHHPTPVPFTDNEPLELNLAPFEEDYGRLDLLFDQFSYQAYVPLPSQSKTKEAKEKDDAQNLIPVCARDSDEAKEFNGTQWKYGQFHLRIIGPDGRPANAFLPESWLPKETGVNMRVKVRGASVSRKLIIEFTATLDCTPVHRSFLEFHVLDHVTGYDVLDMSIKERSGKGASQSRHEMQDSYLVVHFVTNGGIGIGLDYDAPFLNSEDKKLLLFARNLALNFSADPKSRKHVAFRLNARWIDYTSEDAQTKRKREEMERLRRQVFDFPKGATWNLGPYRNQQGKVMTQWGMLMGRKYVQREGNGIMEHHAQNSFANLDEARIIFTYASYLEYQRELRIAQSVSANPQHVAFIKVTDSIIMALVKFTLPASEDGAVDRFVPRDGTVIKIGFRPPNKFGLKKTFCSAIAMPNVFNLPYESNALFYVPGASFGFYQKFAVEVGQRVIFLPAAIAIRVPAAGAQRQVDAMNRLCYPAQERWHRILLNQHAGARRIIDPFSGLDFDSEEVETAIDTVLNIPGITWTAGQRKVIESLREFPERLLLIEGFPGTGKSLTLMGIAAVCRLLDIHVIYTTPTHFAGDAACETADKFMQLSHMSMDVLRVYRPVSEARAFQTHGRDTRKEVTDDEEHENFDPSEFTQMGPMPQSAIEDESFIPMNVSSDSQVLISQLINNMKEDHFAKSYGVPSKSLESHVIRLAMNEERTLVASYPSEEQIAKSKGDLYDLIEDGLDPEGEEVDMLAEIRKFTSMLQEKNFRQFSDEEKRKALLAFKKAAQLVVQEATFLISTNNNAGDSMISTHFGKDAKAIIQIRDEDFKETEPNSWVFAAKSVFSHKVVGIISCGDEKQLQPTVLSAYDQPKLNEFSAQLRLPMPTRLSRMGHPTHKLDEQFRYRPVFAEFPNRRTYNGQLKSHPSTNEITVLPGYLKAMKALILTGPTPAVGFVGKDNDPNVPSIDTPRHSSNIDYGNLVISVRNSTCTVEEVGKSRYNDAHRLLVVQIVMMNHRHGGYKSGDITVITPYTAQLVRIRQTFFRMVQLGILSPENVPFVSTTDSMQGKESKLVIYDWVISSADRMSDLGFTTDDHRGNVGLTRVIEAMVNILPGEIGNSRFLVQPQERHNYMGELVKSRVPYPCEFISWANQQGLLLEVECPDEQSLMKEPVGGVIGKLTRAVSTKPLGRISQASTGAATTLWSSATQVMTWVFSRKRTNADSNNSDVISNVPENINAPEEHTDPLEGPNNEWTAPPDTASEVWHDNHTEMLEPSVGDETAVAADSSLPLEAFSQVQSEPPVVSPPEITVIGVENSAVADEDIAPCIGEWSSGWAASGADW